MQKNLLQNDDYKLPFSVKLRLFFSAKTIALILIAASIGGGIYYWQNQGGALKGSVVTAESLGCEKSAAFLEDLIKNKKYGASDNTIALNINDLFTTNGACANKAKDNPSEWQRTMCAYHIYKTNYEATKSNDKNFIQVTYKSLLVSSETYKDYACKVPIETISLVNKKVATTCRASLIAVDGLIKADKSTSKYSNTFLTSLETAYKNGTNGNCVQVIGGGYPESKMLTCDYNEMQIRYYAKNTPEDYLKKLLELGGERTIAKCSMSDELKGVIEKAGKSASKCVNNAENLRKALEGGTLKEDILPAMAAYGKDKCPPISGDLKQKFDALMKKCGDLPKKIEDEIAKSSADGEKALAEPDVKKCSLGTTVFNDKIKAKKAAEDAKKTAEDTKKAAEAKAAEDAKKTNSCVASLDFAKNKFEKTKALKSEQKFKEIIKYIEETGLDPVKGYYNECGEGDKKTIKCYYYEADLFASLKINRPFDEIEKIFNNAKTYCGTIDQETMSLYDAVQKSQQPSDSSENNTPVGSESGDAGCKSVIDALKMNIQNNDVSHSKIRCAMAVKNKCVTDQATLDAYKKLTGTNCAIGVSGEAVATSIDQQNGTQTPDDKKKEYCKTVLKNLFDNINGGSLSSAKGWHQNAENAGCDLTAIEPIYQQFLAAEEESQIQADEGSTVIEENPEEQVAAEVNNSNPNTLTNEQICEAKKVEFDTLLALDKPLTELDAKLTEVEAIPLCSLSAASQDKYFAKKTIAMTPTPSCQDYLIDFEAAIDNNAGATAVDAKYANLMGLSCQVSATLKTKYDQYLQQQAIAMNGQSSLPSYDSYTPDAQYSYDDLTSYYSYEEGDAPAQTQTQSQTTAQALGQAQTQTSSQPAAQAIAQVSVPATTQPQAFQQLQQSQQTQTIAQNQTQLPADISQNYNALNAAANVLQVGTNVAYQSKNNLITPKYKPSAAKRVKESAKTGPEVMLYPIFLLASICMVRMVNRRKQRK